MNNGRGDRGGIKPRSREEIGFQYSDNDGIDLIIQIIEPLLP